MTAAGLAVRLVDHALAELSERAERMPVEQLQADLDGLLGAGRSAASDLVAAILSRELARRDEEEHT